MEAVGVLAKTFIKANLALVVAVPPIKASSVAFTGKSDQVATVHQESPPPDWATQAKVPSVCA